MEGGFNINFDSESTRKLYYYICAEYKIKFMIYKGRFEKVTSDEIFEFASSFLMKMKGIDLYADIQK